MEETEVTTNQPIEVTNIDYVAEYEKLKNDLLYKTAEIQTLKRKLVEQSAKDYQRGEEFVIKRMMSLYNVISCAIAMKPSDDLQLVMNELSKQLRLSGVELIMSVPGDPYDASKHEATAVIPGDEQGTQVIVKTISPGYKVNGIICEYEKVVIKN